MKRVLITGYKAAELGIFSNKHPGIPIIKKAITKQLVALMDEGLEWVIVSGQWGVEVWAAEAAIELKLLYPDLQLAIITPFLEQEEKWSDDKKTIYSYVLQHANYVNSVSKSKYEGPWQFKEKNKFLLRNSDGLIVVYDDDTEGSPQYIREQARSYGATAQAGYPIISITAFDLQDVAEEEQRQYD